MRRLILLLAAASLAAPAVAQDPHSAYEQGVAARRAGALDRAVSLLAQAVRENPRSADAQVQYGYALLGLGRLEAAQDAFDAALRLAPDYEDARVGQALIAERRGQGARARALLTPVAADHVEANALRRRLAAPDAGARWSVDVDGGGAQVGGGQSDWRHFDIQLRHRNNSGQGVAGRIESARRFGRTDIYAEVRGEQPVGPNGSAYLLAGTTPGADFRPRWQIGAGGRVRVSTGNSPTVLTLDTRHADYRSGAITLLNPGVEQYLARGRAWVTVQSINLVADGDVRSGWLGRADALAGDRLRLTLGAADAPDADQGIVTRTHSLFAGASFEASETTDVRLNMMRDRPDNGPERFGVSIGATVDF